MLEKGLNIISVVFLLLIMGGAVFGIAREIVTDQVIECDFNSTKTELIICAESGDMFAQGKLGDEYRRERPPNFTEAAKWYRMSASQGGRISQYHMGELYENGLGVPQDYYEAIGWYQKSADQGYGNAQERLGHLYFEGNGTTQDYVVGYMWLNLAWSDMMFDVSEERHKFTRLMTKEQIAEAQELSRQWKEDHPVNPY